MDRYIGLDAHSTSCTLVVVSPSGRKLANHVLETNGHVLIDCIKTIPRPRHLCLEEGTQSAWLYEILSPHVDELVVAGVSQSRGPKSDARDALGLAQALRLGAVETRVFKAPTRFSRLRELASTYDKLTRDVTRTQTRLKTLFRSRGIVAARSVYGLDTRDEWLARLPSQCHASALLYWQQFDHLAALKRDARKQLVAESHRHPISEVLETCPGFGPIRVALTIPVVVVPQRFRTARQLWSYSGLGIVMRSSSDWIRNGEHWERATIQKTRGLTRTFNRRLKYVFKGAATTVITKLAGTPMHDDYERMLDAGTKPNLAKLTLARKIAATFLAMWKNEEVYDSERHRTQGSTHA
jgi:transposase